MKFKVSVADQLEYKLKAVAGAITAAHLNAARDMMQALAADTHAQATKMATQRLNSTAQKYVDHLNWAQASENIWTITLDKDAAYLEEGFGAYDMIAAGLARGPKSKLSKAGYRYVIIPFEHKEGIARANNRQHNTPTQRGQTNESTKGNLAKDLQTLKASFGRGGKNNVLRDSGGSPIFGKAYTITKNPLGPMWNYKDATGRTDSAHIEGGAINKNLNGLTAIQWEQKLRSGGSRVQTSYLTWRVASENPVSAGRWKHPGFDGAKIFPDLEQWAVGEMNSRMRSIFEG